MKRKLETQQLPFMRPMIDFSAKVIERDIISSKIRNSDIVLDDKSVLSIKPFVVDVRRAANQWNEEGQPLYLVKIGFSINTKAPKKLMKPIPNDGLSLYPYKFFLRHINDGCCVFGWLLLGKLLFIR
jgi:hypothetical protein